MWNLILFVWLTVARAGDVTIDVLDIGQGDSILVRGGGKTVLIDAGDRPSNTVAQLQSLGVTRLDLVVATHPHADHIGRMPEVLQTFAVGLYLDNGLPHTTQTYLDTMALIESKQIPYRTAQRGTKLNLGGEATFTVLFPDSAGPLRDTRSDLNSNSVVLRLDHGENSFLFTGDAEEPTEQRLLADGLGQIDVLKVAHHGSNHSSTAGFLRTVDPTYALISVGRENRYHHPGVETMDRLGASGAMIYRTDLSGNLRVLSDGVHIEVLEGGLPELAIVRTVPWDDRVSTIPRRGRGSPTPGNAADPLPAPKVTPPPAPVEPTRAPPTAGEPTAKAADTAETGPSDKEVRKADKAARKAARRKARDERKAQGSGGLY